jgi:hypothetical protein
VIDWHRAAWSRTPLVMNFQYPPGMRHACARGAGWRCDGADSRGCAKRVEDLLAEPAIRDAWQRGLVTGEPIVQQLLSPRETYSRLLHWHASTLNLKSQPIPDDAVPAMEVFLKRCGYRLVLRELRSPQRVTRGGQLSLRMEFENIGVAPPYRAYVLAMRLKAGGNAFIQDTDARLAGWLPGRHAVDARLPLPGGLVAGDYELAIGVLDPHDRHPEVKLAIEGRADDGWYPLTSLRVET